MVDRPSDNAFRLVAELIWLPSVWRRLYPLLEDACSTLCSSVEDSSWGGSQIAHTGPAFPVRNVHYAERLGTSDGFRQSLRGRRSDGRADAVHRLVENAARPGRALVAGAAHDGPSARAKPLSDAAVVGTPVRSG